MVIGRYRYFIALAFCFSASADQIDVSRAEAIAGVTAAGAKQLYTSTNGQMSMTLFACEDQTLSSCWVSMAGSSINVTQATANNNVKASAGETIGFYVNSTTSGTIRFYDDSDGTCSSGAKGGTITPAIGYHDFPMRYSTGICALTGGTAVDITVVYR